MIMPAFPSLFTLYPGRIALAIVCFGLLFAGGLAAAINTPNPKDQVLRAHSDNGKQSWNLKAPFVSASHCKNAVEYLRQHFSEIKTFNNEKFNAKCTSIDKEAKANKQSITQDYMPSALMLVHATNPDHSPKWNLVKASTRQSCSYLLNRIFASHMQPDIPLLQTGVPTTLITQTIRFTCIPITATSPDHH